MGLIIVLAVIAVAMIYFLVGIVVDLENERVVRQRRDLMEKFNDLRRGAWQEGVDIKVTTRMDLGGGLVFDAKDIGFDESHILAGVEQNIAAGKQDPVCRLATEQDLRRCVLRYYLLYWPTGLVILRGHRVMLRHFREYVEEQLPRQLQTAITRKKMIEGGK